MTDGWQKDVSGQMKRLRQSLEALRIQKRRVPDPEKYKIEALTGKVEEALKAIEEDKSKGVHNFTYAKRLISEAEKRVLTTQRSIPAGQE
jgi:hypothetical protein